MTTTPFQIFFLVTTLDAYVNGPRLKHHKNEIGLVIALLALLAGENAYAYLLAEVVLVVMYLAEIYEYDDLVIEKLGLGERRKAVVVAAKPVETSSATGGVEEEAVPAKVLEALREGMKKFHANADPNATLNCDNKAWNLLDDSNGIKIFQSDFPGQSVKRWRVQCVVQTKLTRDEIFAQLFDYGKRCPPTGWDMTLQSGKVLKTYKAVPKDLGEEVSVSQYYTAPAAGGAVSSREIVDVGLIRKLDNGGLEYVHFSCSKDLQPHLPMVPDKVVGVRAFTFPGAGMRVEPIPNQPGMWNYTLSSSLALGGWIPSSIIASATTGALTDTHRTMKEHLAKA